MVVWLWFFLICFTNTLRESEDRYKGVRQTDLDQQARHLPVIFENLGATLRITLSLTENTREILNRIIAIWVVVRTTFIVSKTGNEVKIGNSLQQYRLVFGMHSVNLVTKEFRRCFKGKFWCSVVLLFYLERMRIGFLEPLVAYNLLKKDIRIFLCPSVKIHVLFRKRIL